MSFLVPLPLDRHDQILNFVLKLIPSASIAEHKAKMQALAFPKGTTNVATSRWEGEKKNFPIQLLTLLRHIATRHRYDAGHYCGTVGFLFCHIFVSLLNWLFFHAVPPAYPIAGLEKLSASLDILRYGAYRQGPLFYVCLLPLPLPIQSVWRKWMKNCKTHKIERTLCTPFEKRWKEIKTDTSNYFDLSCLWALGIMRQPGCWRKWR